MSNIKSIDGGAFKAGDRTVEGGPSLIVNGIFS